MTNETACVARARMEEKMRHTHNVFRNIPASTALSLSHLGLVASVCCWFVDRVVDTN